MSFWEIVETAVLTGTSIVALKMGFDAAGGIRILRSPKVLLPFIGAVAGIGAALLCAYGVDRVRAGTLSGISSSILLRGMVVGLLVGASGFALAFLPNMRRQRRIEACRENLRGVVDPSTPVMLLGPPSELNELKKHLLEYRELLAGLPSPDDYDRRQFVAVQERIDRIDHSLGARREADLPG